MKMRIQKVKWTKTLKMFALLISALLIATASAAVYYSLNSTATITVAGTDVWFEAGTDNGTACTVTLSPQKSVATITGLKAYANASQTYENPIDVHNNSTSQAYQVRLRHVSLSGNDTEFVYIKFTLNASAGSVTLNYTCDGSSWTIPSDTAWTTLAISEDASVIIETKAKDNATAGAAVTIQIAVDVQ